MEQIIINKKQKKIRRFSIIFKNISTILKKLSDNKLKIRNLY